MNLPARKYRFVEGHMAGNRRKLQEGFRAQETRALANFHKRFGGAGLSCNLESQSLDASISRGGGKWCCSGNSF